MLSDLSIVAARAKALQGADVEFSGKGDLRGFLFVGVILPGAVATLASMEPPRFEDARVGALFESLQRLEVAIRAGRGIVEESALPGDGGSLGFLNPLLLEGRGKREGEERDGEEEEPFDHVETEESGREARGAAAMMFDPRDRPRGR